MSGLGRVLDSYLFGWGPKSSKMSVESNVLVEIADDQLDEVHFLASTGRNPNHPFHSINWSEGTITLKQTWRNDGSFTNHINILSINPRHVLYHNLAMIIAITPLVDWVKSWKKKPANPMGPGLGGTSCGLSNIMLEDIHAPAQNRLHTNFLVDQVLFWGNTWHNRQNQENKGCNYDLRKKNCLEKHCSAPHSCSEIPRWLPNTSNQKIMPLTHLMMSYQFSFLFTTGLTFSLDSFAQDMGPPKVSNPVGWRRQKMADQHHHFCNITG